MQRTVSLRRSRSGSKTFWLTTMMLPVTVWLLVIRYLPMFGIVMSFLDYRLPTRKLPFPRNLFKSPWVGLKNFNFLFTGESLGVDPLWINALRLIALTVLLFSGEELLLVLLSRLIWRRQRRIELPSLSERSLRAHRESKRR